MINDQITQNFLQSSHTMKVTVNFVTIIVGLTTLLGFAHKGIDTAKSNGCPLCHCEVRRTRRPEIRAEIVCDRISDADAIKEVLNATSTRSEMVFKAFSLCHSNLTRLPVDTFGKTSFKEIIFKSSFVNIIDRFAFVESENFSETVTFSEVEFGEEFTMDFLQPLRHLRKLVFSESNFLSIHDNAFGNLPRLEEILFSKIKFRKIGKFAFASLPRLKKVELMESNITKLEANWFNTSQCKDSITLSLYFNNIQEIEPGAFADLKAHYVSLSFNNLKTLDQSVFEPLLDSMRRYLNPSLFVLANDIDCGSSIQWLRDKPFAFRKIVKRCFCTREFRCRMPTQPPSHGSIALMTGTMQNQRIIYACDDNFVPFGNAEIECLSDGRWSSPPLQCLPTCVTFDVEGGFFVRPNVTDNFKQNAIRNGKRFPPNTILTIVCDEWYKIDYGDSISDTRRVNVTCQEGKRWWPSIHCVPVGCNCTDIIYDSLFSRNLTLGEKCEVRISHGMEIALLCKPHTLYFATDYKVSLKCYGTYWVYPRDPDERCIPERPDSCYLFEVKLNNGKTYIDGLEWQFVTGTSDELFRHGTELKFECSTKGYELYVGDTALSNPLHAVNSTVMRCESGYWIGRMPVCKPARCSCSILSQYLDELGLIVKDCGDFVNSGDFIQLYCSDLSALCGTQYAECEFGEWNPISANYIDCNNHFSVVIN